MKYGKPVIVSNRGALPELVTTGKDGLVFHHGENTSTREKQSQLPTLAACLIGITEQVLAVMQENAQQNYMKRFRSQRMIDDTVEVMLSEKERSK